MPDTAQHALWNGPSGHAWVEAERILDQMFAPFALLLAQAIPAHPPARVLDVGCGTGAVSLEIATRLGSGGHCTGVDISAPLITRAITRAASAGLPVDFIVADAQRLALPPASFDRIVSRFGVMFFDDPAMAFSNLRQATRRGGALHAIAWRSAAENPFMTTAERAAAPLLALPARVANAPGQFAFADRDRVIAILTEAGWQDIEVVAREVACEVDAADLPAYVTLLGPVGSALRSGGIEPALRARVVQAMDEAFAPFVVGDRVRFDAACWELRAVAP
ncbi:class I SAM-dependent methyltransferase [Stenotrophomonas sp.]|uniref:class I SAM-dependent methyltransferase n=1 Tax=Stenotrophomonas sp. TaxID=69392 RepID=UPI0028A25696|nr:class I SAM-dependent methyltransferase [Stenotrophomonas sp.]